MYKGVIAIIIAWFSAQETVSAGLPLPASSMHGIGGSA